MISVVIDNKEYQVPETNMHMMYLPVTDLSIPAQSEQDTKLTESSGQINRIGFVHIGSLVGILARRIKELEKQVND